MSKFERIVREPLVMGGQARIRDTGITVNEVVRLSLAGSSQAEILQQFPMLEAEDVHQALSNAMDDAFHTIKHSSNDGMTPLTGLRGFVDILVHDTFNAIKASGNDSLIPPKTLGLDFSRKEPLSPEERFTFLNVLQRQIMQAITVWHNLHNYATIISRSNRAYDYWTLSAHKLLEEIDYSFRELNLNFEIQKPESDVLLKIASGFSVSRLPRAFNDIKKLNLKTKADAKNLNFLMVVEGELAEDFEFAVQAYQPIGTLAWLVYLSGSELKIRQEENSVIFEFALPIVES